MAEPNKSSSSSDSQIPPPLDPFPTYQTPYSHGSSQEDHNPFISFRRFADEQLSSLFSGLPRLLGVPLESSLHSNSLSSRRRAEEEQSTLEQALADRANKLEERIADMVRRRHEEAEGFRKQIEQEMEERRIENEQMKEQQALQQLNWSRPYESSRPVPADKEQQCDPSEDPRWAMLQRGFERCPGMQLEAIMDEQPIESDHSEWVTMKRKLDAQHKMQADVAAARQTELDMYEQLDETGARIPAEDRQCPYRSERRRKWLPALGYDGRQKARNITLSADGDHSSSQNPDEVPASAADSQSEFVNKLQPFKSDNDLIPWLAQSKYSPVNLTFPDDPAAWQLIPGLVESEVVHGAKRPKAFTTSPTDLDYDMANHLPWLDAFEDLFRLSKTGEMQPRNMVSMYGMFPVHMWSFENPFVAPTLAFRRHVGQDVGHKQGVSFNRRSDGSEYDAIQAAASRNSSTAASNPGLNTADESRDQHDTDIHIPRDSTSENTSPFGLLGAHGMIWPTPEAILALVSQAKELELESASEESAHDEAPLQQVKSGNKNNFWSSSTSSMSSWTTNTDGEQGTVVSTLTTTQTKTLPDGSSETRRVLKKRFADGREESNESVEIKPAPSQHVAIRNREAGGINKEIQTSSHDSRKQRDVGRGWFWN